MAEENRMRMGLGPQGYHAQRFGFAQNYQQYFEPSRLQPMQMHLSQSLRTAYQPCTLASCLYSHSLTLHTDMQTGFNPNQFRRDDFDRAAAYYDLMRYENELRRARNLSEAQRLKLWDQRYVTCSTIRFPLTLSQTALPRA